MNAGHMCEAARQYAVLSGVSHEVGRAWVTTDRWLTLRDTPRLKLATQQGQGIDMQGIHGAQVVQLRLLGGSALREVGPVVRPVGGAQVPAADASQLLDRNATVSWYATGAPVGYGLDGLAKGISEPLQAELRDCGVKWRSGCHLCSLHVSCSLSTHRVSTYDDTPAMPGTVWNRIERELLRRKDARELLSNWAALGDKLGVTSQVTTNWKTRGVPPKRYQDIAEALGWTVEQLLGKDEIDAVESQVDQGDLFDAYRRIIEVLSEEDRREVYAFALGRALKGDPELAKRAAQYAAGTAGNTTPHGRGQHQGGMSNFGGLDDLAEADQKKAGGGRR